MGGDYTRHGYVNKCHSTVILRSTSRATKVRARSRVGRRDLLHPMVNICSMRTCYRLCTRASCISSHTHTHTHARARIIIIRTAVQSKHAAASKMGPKTFSLDEDGSHTDQLLLFLSEEHMTVASQHVTIQ